MNRSRRETDHAQPALCMFEYIYFARPDSKFNDRSVYMARYAMGRQLAKEHPVDADVVMAVPDSAVAGGIGYATESGLPYIEGLIKNRYIGRTFISPDQRMRARGVHLKFNPVVENLTRAARDRRRRLDRARHDHAADRCVAARSRRARGALAHHLAADQASRAISASIWRRTTSSSRRTIRSKRFGARPAPIRSVICSLDGLIASVGRKREEMCLGCLIGEYPNVPAAHEVQQRRLRLSV